MRYSVVLGVTLRLLVINISSSSPVINTAAHYQRCVTLNVRDGGRGPPATVFTTPASCSVNTGSQARYICSESRFLPTPPAFDVPLGRLPSEYRYAVWHGKTKMVCMATPMVKKSLQIMFIRFDMIHERDRHTPHDSIGRACVASRGKNAPVT